MVSALSVRPKKLPSPTWRTFLNSQVKELVALDFFVVPTVTYKVLCVLRMLSHHRASLGPPGEVEVIVLHPEAPLRSRVRGRKQPLRVHPAAGIWANREDIGETMTYVSQLRHRLETRRDAQP